MSGFLLIQADDVPPQPWRNGGGVTRELIAWPDARDWRVRISVADIESDGPFSTFPGVQRWFAVLKGAGVELCIDGAAHRLTRSDAPIAFAGAAQTTCRLIDGPTRDLNLMLRDASGSMRVAEDGQDWQPQLVCVSPRSPQTAPAPRGGEQLSWERPGDSCSAQCALFTAVAGRCIADGHDIAMPPYALLWFAHAPARLAFVAGQRPAAAVGWWLTATPEEPAA